MMMVCGCRRRCAQLLENGETEHGRHSWSCFRAARSTPVSNAIQVVLSFLVVWRTLVILAVHLVILAVHLHKLPVILLAQNAWSQYMQ